MKSIYICERTLPEAWEKAVLKCWEQGASFPTQYDKPNDPNSIDVTAMIHITNPMAEPRIHKCQVLGLSDQEKYRNEIVLGIHDYYMDDLDNPKRWEYTYASRMNRFDQIEKCVDILKKCPYSRRAKIDIWDVQKDLSVTNEHPPCLQYLFLRVENGKLNMNGHIRSNDLFKATFANWWGISELQCEIAKKLDVDSGELIWVADSLHLYGSYFHDIEKFVEKVKSSEIEDRTYTYGFAKEFFIDGCKELLLEPKMPENKKELVRQRLAFLEK